MEYTIKEGENKMTMPFLYETLTTTINDENFWDALASLTEEVEDTPKPQRVIFNDPATIVFWPDGTKTVVKASNEPFDKEKGLAMAICKYFYGNKGNYNEIFKEWI